MVTKMQYEIEKNLDSKDAKRFGTRKICGTKVYWTRQKVASHLRSGNCTKSKLTTILPNEQMHSRTESPPTAFSRRTATPMNDADQEDAVQIANYYVSPQERNKSLVNTSVILTSEKKKEYIDQLQQFLYLPLVEKKQYLRNRAPNSFIHKLREILRNVRNGVVPCDDSLTKKISGYYCYDRIDQKSVSPREARHHLCQSRILDPLIRVLPFVLKYYIHY